MITKIMNTADGLSFRPFVEADLPRLRDMCANVWGGRDFLPSVAGKLASDPKVIFLAGTEAEGRIIAVGFAMLIDGGKTAYLGGLRVDESLQKRGIGSAFIRRLLRDSALAGATRARFSRDRRSKATARIAEATGFKSVLQAPVLRVEEEGVEALTAHLTEHTREAQPEGGALIETSRLEEFLATKPDPKQCNGSGIVLDASWKCMELEHVQGVHSVVYNATSFSMSFVGELAAKSTPMYCIFLAQSCQRNEIALHMLRHLEISKRLGARDVIFHLMPKDALQWHPDLFSFAVPDLKELHAEIVERDLNDV